MAFRSTIAASHWGVVWPEWFRKRYASTLGFGHDGAIWSTREEASYGAWESLAEDVQRALLESAHDPSLDEYAEDAIPFVLVYLHECGGVTRCAIYRDRILWSEPVDWVERPRIEHNYCYGCSDLPVVSGG